MSCESWGPFLAAEIYGDNSEADHRALTDHLASCTPCRAQFENWRAVRTQAGSVPGSVDASLWIRQKASILARLPERSAGGWGGRGRWLMPTLAMSLVMMGGWGMHRQSVRRDLPIAQNMDMLQNLDILSHLDVLEAMDQTEAQ